MNMASPPRNNTGATLRRSHAPRGARAVRILGTSLLVLIMAAPSAFAASGLFGPAAGYPAGIGVGSYDVEVADFNGDGQLDIVSANYSSSSIGVLCGNGSGRFGTATQIASQLYPRHLAIGDLNKSGNAPLRQTFNALVQGNGPLGIAVADFNGDGNPDVAAAVYTDKQLTVLFGDGRGAFPTFQRYTTPVGPATVVPGDYNRDGLIDLAVGNGGGLVSFS